MVHLTYTTNAKCDFTIQVWTKTLDLWMEKKHGYKPHNTHWWKTAQSIHTRENIGNINEVWENDAHNYPRKPELFEKDANGRGKMYIEYGWTTLSNKEAQMIGTSGNAISGSPIHPWDQQFTICLRHITDWTEAEQDELNTWFSAYLKHQDYLWRAEDTYTPEELRAWQDNLDYSNATSLVAMVSPEGEKERLVCRICKSALEVGEYGNNPAPLYSSRYKCCDACNSGYVIPARMNMVEEISQVDITGEIDDPFKYPRTKAFDKNKSFYRVGFRKSPLGPICADKRQMKWCEEDRHTLVAQQEMLTKYIKAIVSKEGLPPMVSNKKAEEKLKQANEMAERAEEIVRNVERERKEVEENVKLIRKANEQEKAEIRQKANEARKTLERVKRLSAPKDKQIDNLKTEIARRDERIAELRVLEGVIKSLDGKERARICSEQIAKKIGRCDVIDDFTDNQRGIPAWALDDFRQASQARLTAEVKKKCEGERKKQKSRHNFTLTKCQYCGKNGSAKSLVEVWGDLLCRQCANKYQ